MKLSLEAQRYYEQACGDKLTDIERWFRPEMNQVQSSMASRGMVGGIRNKAIEHVIIERWRRLVQARIESLLEAYEQFEITLEIRDIESFVDKLNEARSNIITSVINHVGEGGGSLQLTSDFEQINSQARQKLSFEMTKAELKRRKKKMKGKKANIHIEGDVIGSSVQTGKKSKANVSTLVNAEFNQTINELRREFGASGELTTTDRDEALKRIDKLTVLAAREESPQRLEKIKKGIEIVAGIASKTKDLIVVVGPLIEKIKDHWHNIQW